MQLWTGIACETGLNVSHKFGCFTKRHYSGSHCELLNIILTYFGLIRGPQDLICVLAPPSQPDTESLTITPHNHLLMILNLLMFRGSLGNQETPHWDRDDDERY